MSHILKHNTLAPQTANAEQWGITAESLPVDLLDSTRLIDVATAFKAGTPMESQPASEIARIGFDVNSIASELLWIQYGRHIGPAAARGSRLVEFNPDLKSSVDRSVLAGYPEDNELLESALSPYNLQALDKLIDNFGFLVLSDARLNHLTPHSTKFDSQSPGTVVVEARIGMYDCDFVVPHVDTADRVVQYVASFGTKGTGFLPIETQADDAFNHGRRYQPQQIDYLSPTYTPKGTIGRFIHGRDLHFAPADNGFRIFLTTTMEMQGQVGRPATAERSRKIATVLKHLRHTDSPG